MNCSSCYELKVECCEDFLLPTALTANTQYYVVFCKPGSNRLFQKLLTSDSEGNILIAKADFPAGYFAAGIFFNVEIRSGADYKTVIPLTFFGDIYNCILIETVDITDLSYYGYA